MGDRTTEGMLPLLCANWAWLPGLPTFARTLVLVMTASSIFTSAVAARAANYDQHVDANAGDALDDVDEENEDDKDDADEDDEDDGVKQYVQELFLGISVYPQDKDEVQLTWGLFNGVEANDRSLAFFELEYGITDRLQVGCELPYEFGGDEMHFDGMRNVGLELYYNFYNDRQTGRALGAGFEIGLPADAPPNEPRAWEYEPFVVAYQDFGGWAVNFSAALEIETFPGQSDDNETVGELAIAVFGPVAPFVPILEFDTQVADAETTLRIAPGLYWHTSYEVLDLAISLPIGLNRDAPDLGIFLLAIVEFDAHSLVPGRGKGTAVRKAVAGR